MSEENEYEAIRRLKYRYFRCLDGKKWEELAECFIPDAETSYEGGKFSFRGVGTIMKFLARSLDDSMISMHHGHHPEIELTGETTATGVWALQDYVINLKANTSMRGAAFYEDEYVKVEGKWKIKSTGFKRLFTETWNRADPKEIRLERNLPQP